MFQFILILIANGMAILMFHLNLEYQTTGFGLHPIAAFTIMLSVSAIVSMLITTYHKLAQSPNGG